MEMVKHEAKLRENRLEEQARRLRFLLDRHEEAATAAAGRHAESKARAIKDSKEEAANWEGGKRLTTAAEEIVAAKLEAKERILFAKRGAERAVESVLEEAAAATQRVQELKAQLHKASPSRHQVARVVDSHLNPHDGSETWTVQVQKWPLLGSSADRHSSSILPSPHPPTNLKPHPSQRQRQYEQGKRIVGQLSTLDDVRNAIAYDESSAVPLNTILIVQRSDRIW
jgi:hypothetical protein